MSTSRMTSSLNHVDDPKEECRFAVSKPSEPLQLNCLVDSMVNNIAQNQMIKMGEVIYNGMQYCTKMMAPPVMVA